MAAGRIAPVYAAFARFAGGPELLEYHGIDGPTGTITFTVLKNPARSLRDALTDSQLETPDNAIFLALSRSNLFVKMHAMKLCRFKKQNEEARIGLVIEDSTLLDLTAAGVQEMSSLLEAENPLLQLQQFMKKNPPRLTMSAVKLLAPVERQEVWAAGVTYLRSKTARMEESDFSANAYDKVYAAERPEIFFKSLPDKVVGTNETVGIRRDARWNVPEPELALVMNSKGKIVGYTIGNDMSSRDIEGENLLYLPQAKIYERSCALGPWIHLGASESETREWKIKIEIKREGQDVFTGETSVGQIKRNFEKLAGFLFRSQKFPHGVILLTGTGVVPPDTFTLRETDLIEIEISGIGLLKNSVVVV